MVTVPRGDENRAVIFGSVGRLDANLRPFSKRPQPSSSAMRPQWKASVITCYHGFISVCNINLHMHFIFLHSFLSYTFYEDLSEVFKVFWGEHCIPNIHVVPQAACDNAPGSVLHTGCTVALMWCISQPVLSASKTNLSMH